MTQVIRSPKVPGCAEHDIAVALEREAEPGQKFGRFRTLGGLGFLRAGNVPKNAEWSSHFSVSRTT